MELYLPNFRNSCYDNKEEDISLLLFSTKSYDDRFTSNKRIEKINDR